MLHQHLFVRSVSGKPILRRRNKNVFKYSQDWFDDIHVCRRLKKWLMNSNHMFWRCLNWSGKSVWRVGLNSSTKRMFWKTIGSSSILRIDQFSINLTTYKNLIIWQFWQRRNQFPKSFFVHSCPGIDKYRISSD